MEVLSIGILIILAIVLFFRFKSREYELKIEEEKNEEERLKLEKKRKEISDQISQFAELKKEFKKVLAIDLNKNDYRDWINDLSGNPGETFIGYMIRKNRIELLNVKIEQILEKCNVLSAKELYSITPIERGVNLEETKIRYKRFYWEDRKKDME